MKIKYICYFLLILIIFSQMSFLYSETKDTIPEVDKLIANKDKENNTNHIPLLELSIANGLPYLLQFAISSSPFDNIFIECNYNTSLLLDSSRIIAGYQQIIDSVSFLRFGIGSSFGGVSNYNFRSTWDGYSLSIIYMKYYNLTSKRLGWKLSLSVDCGYDTGESYPKPWREHVRYVIPSVQAGIFFRIL
jgi:hypothetical protein